MRVVSAKIIVCDKRMPINVAIYTTFIRPVLMYGSEILAPGKAEYDFLEKIDMAMLRWLGHVNKLKKSNWCSNENMEVSQYLKMRRRKLRWRCVIHKARRQV